MYKFFAFLISLFCLTGCLRFFPTTTYNPPVIPRPDVAPVASVVLDYATKLKHEKDLHLDDSRIIFDDSLRRIRLDFHSQDIMELCDARFLLVDIVEELLERLNNNEMASEQSLKRHFDYFDLEINIHYECFYIHFCDPMYISYITLCNGISSFYSGEVSLVRLDSWHARSEEYYKSRLFANIMRESEKIYDATHPIPQDERKYFGRSVEAPTDWFSK